MKKHNLVFLISAFLLLGMGSFLIINGTHSFRFLMGIIAILASIIFAILGWFNK